MDLLEFEKRVKLRGVLVFIPVNFLKYKPLNNTDMYTINFVNESQMQGDFVIFQQSPWPTVIYPLAWETIRAAPNGMPIRFTWEKDYVFFSAQSGQLAPGVRIVPCCQVEANLDSMNEVTLEADFRLINARPGQPGHCLLYTSPSPRDDR